MDANCNDIQSDRKSDSGPYPLNGNGRSKCKLLQPSHIHTPQLYVIPPRSPFVLLEYRLADLSLRPALTTPTVPQCRVMCDMQNPSSVHLVLSGVRTLLWKSFLRGEADVWRLAFTSFPACPRLVPFCLLPCFVDGFHQYNDVLQCATFS